MQKRSPTAETRGAPSARINNADHLLTRLFRRRGARSRKKVLLQFATGRNGYSILQKTKIQSFICEQLDIYVYRASSRDSHVYNALLMDNRAATLLRCDVLFGRQRGPGI